MKSGDIRALMIEVISANRTKGEVDLPKMLPYLGVPRDIAQAYNNAERSCCNCLAKLQLSKAALPEISILRIVLGTYGNQRDLNNNIIVGGVELELQDLDHSLIAEYPVKIHVLSKSLNRDQKHEVHTGDPGKGSLSVSTIPDLGLYAGVTREALKEAMSQTRYDLIHLHRVKGSSVEAVVEEARKRGIPIVLTHHNCVPGKSFIRRSLKQKASSVLKNFIGLAKNRGLFSALSIFTEDLVRKIRQKFKPVDIYKDLVEHSSEVFKGSPLVGVSEHATQIFKGARSIVIGSAMDTDFFKTDLVYPTERSTLRKSHLLPAGRKIICYHSRIVPAKGQINLIPVALELKDKLGENFHFVIAGTIEDPAYLGKIKLAIRESNLQDNFSILPALSTRDIRTLLSMSSAFVFPTHYEALGRAAIEAQLMKVPVVANRVGGIPSYIRNAETGMLVEKGDAPAMARALIQVLTDKDLRNRIVPEAEKLARKKFGASRIAGEYMAMAYGPLLYKKQN